MPAWRAGDSGFKRAFLCERKPRKRKLLKVPVGPYFSKMYIFSKNYLKPTNFFNAMKPQIETTTSGFKYKGGWNEVCEFSRNLEEIIEDNVPDKDSIESYNNWRPRENENTEDMKKKTAEEAANRNYNLEKISGVVHILNKIEKNIYEKIMLKFNPCYFDTEYFSINFKENNSKNYELNMNISNEKRRKSIKSYIKEYM